MLGDVVLLMVVRSGRNESTSSIYKKVSELGDAKFDVVVELQFFDSKMKLSFGGLKEVVDSQERIVLCGEGVAPTVVGEVVGEYDEVVLPSNAEKEDVTNHVDVNALEWVRSSLMRNLVDYSSGLGEVVGVIEERSGVRKFLKADHP